MVHKYQQTGITLRTLGSGRPRKTSLSDDHFLRLWILRNRGNTTVSVQDLLQIRGVVLSKQTVYRHLKEVNLKAKGHVKESKLLSTKRNLVENYGDWNIPEW